MCIGGRGSAAPVVTSLPPPPPPPPTPVDPAVTKAKVVNRAAAALAVSSNSTDATGPQGLVNTPASTARKSLLGM